MNHSDLENNKYMDNQDYNTSGTYKQFSQVKEFMQVFGKEAPDKPTIPSLKIRMLRAKLILEEALEEIDALGLCVEGQCDIVESNIEPDLVLIADGLADSHYVGYLGTAIACGINNMDEIFDEVHRSNMTKLWTDTEMTKIPSNKGYLFKQVRGGIPSNPHTRCWLVKDSYGKAIKSPSYSPAKIIVK